MRRNFQDQATPGNMHISQIDNAMSSLNDALNDLGKLRVRTDADTAAADFELTTSEYNDCVDSFVYLVRNMLIPDLVLSPLTPDFLRVLPVVVSRLNGI
jgi:hypothetical protein